jgi:DNA modification methylase
MRDVFSHRARLRAGRPFQANFWGIQGFVNIRAPLFGGARDFSNPRGTMHNLQIEQMPIHALRPQDRNVRTHSKRQIRQMADSIKRFGFTNPILTDDDSQIIAGHARLEAAKLLGMTTVPSVRLSHLSAAEKRAYIIADNEIALKAGWDREILAIELQGLIDIGFDVELTGFEPAEIDLILSDWREASIEAATPEDEHAQLSESAAVSRLGDLWTLGCHRLLCGDARSPEAYGRLLGPDRVDLVFTDPPYNVKIEGHVSGRGRVQHREFAMASGEMTEPEFTSFLTQVFRAAADVSRDGALHYICMDWRHLFEALSAGRAAYSSFLNLCVWNKDNGGMGSLYRSKHELVLVFKAGTKSHTNNVELGRHGRNRTNVWEYAGVNTFRTGRLDELSMHPTVKPVALIADAIKDASKRSNLVLDPFSGSGSTIVAAEKTGRRGYGIEIDPRYVDIAILRWQRYTGKSARLDGSGASFEEIAVQRSASLLPETGNELAMREEHAGQ